MAKIPKGYTCKKVKGKKLYMCSLLKKKKGSRAAKRGTTRRIRGGPRTRGVRMREAKKRAAKMPGGKGPVAKRPAGRKVLRT